MDIVVRARLSTSYDLRTITVDLALAVAEMIDVVETGEANEPENPTLASYRQNVDEVIALLRKNLEDV
jgi:hypothetical protein